MLVPRGFPRIPQGFYLLFWWLRCVWNDMTGAPGAFKDHTDFEIGSWLVPGFSKSLGAGSLPVP